MQRENTKGQVGGVVGVAIYALVIIALIVWGSFTIQRSDVLQGMIVDFGVSEESGFGEQDPQVADNVTYPEPNQTPEDQPAQTQDFEEAPEQEEANTESDITALQKEQKPVEKEPAEEQEKPAVNQLALFPGGSVDSESTGEGEVEETVGNQGYEGGAESSMHLGTGNVDGYVPDWSLDGRKLINKLKRPTYKGKESGIVVIDICVNAEGFVTSAEFRAKGSTVGPSSPLVTEAKKSARTARFNTSEDDFAYGTITFKYVLKH